MAGKKKTSIDEEILRQIKDLADRAKEISGQQAAFQFDEGLGEEDIDTSFNHEALDDTADPEKSHRLYYTMMGIMKRNLPPGGGNNKKLRQHVYAEKSLFLNRGKDKDERGIRGSDERMAFIPNYLQVALDTTHKWVAQGADPFELFIAFRELNKRYGHIDESEGDEGQSTIDFTPLPPSPPSSTAQQQLSSQSRDAVQVSTSPPSPDHP